jgi:hypothetical protein
MDFESKNLLFQEISFGDIYSMCQLFADPRCIREYSRNTPITPEIMTGARSMIRYSVANQQHTPRTYVILTVRRKTRAYFVGYVRAIMERDIIEVYFDFFPIYYRKEVIMESLSAFLEKLPPVLQLVVHDKRSDTPERIFKKLGLQRILKREQVVRMYPKLPHRKTVYFRNSWPLISRCQYPCFH